MIVRHLGKRIEIHQWFRNGDHPDDNCNVFRGEDGLDFWGEGHVVRYFRHPQVKGDKKCGHCGYQMHLHGWIEEWLTPNRDEIFYVCPGDWIVKEENNYKSYHQGLFSEVDDLDKRQ